MGEMTIRKLNAVGTETFAYPGRLEARLPGGVRVLARWTRPALDLGYVRFETGDRFTEWFFSDRWYNVFEIRSGTTGALKGWYCNIAEPATITAEAVACRDLLLDLWVAPDGATLLLDEDEFAADVTLDARQREGAQRGLAQLRACVAARRPPFDTASSPPPEPA
ncbi:MAG TPA: DUF402 domain-containing protein [Ktedonobacterales bacterium]|jgi:hypothetical protein